MNISVIISTYNTPLFLTAVLSTLAKQSDSQFEVLIADDGSTQETATVIAQSQPFFSAPLKHIWHNDDGFRAAQIRNKAIKAATGDYIIFIDGDCLLPNHFIEHHRALATPHYFVSGNRVLLTEKFTQDLLHTPHMIPNLNLNNSFFWWCQKKINRWFTLWYIPLGFLRSCSPKKWRGVKTCNLGVWRQDLLTINGFDESYTGWGYEDSDLVLRLIHAGIYNKSGRFATTVFHLWHATNDRSKEQINLAKLKQCISNKTVYVEMGVNKPIVL
jgi:glycosyltransferase involved in cell wall biosynthesis